MTIPERPTIPRTTPYTEPEPGRRLEPDKVCPAQKERIRRRIREVPL